MSKKSSYGIHWFRRDLRVAGNPALQENWKKNEGRVLGIFCFDKKFLARDDFSVNRFQFFIETLKELKKELRAMGGDLLFLDDGPEKSFKDLFEHLEEAPSLFSWNEDYEPFAIKRDKKIQKNLEKFKIETFIGVDHVLVRPTEIEKPYKVFTPFSKKWLQIFEGPLIQSRVQKQQKGLKHLKKEIKDLEKSFSLQWKDLISFEDCLKKYDQENKKKVNIKIPKAGSREAYKKLKVFKKNIDNYQDNRDYPFEKGTSQLSIYLKNGSLTIAQIIAELKLESYNTQRKSSRDTYFSELIWREFYYHVLANFPKVETKEFQEKYEGIRWENNKKWFEHWKNGTTGFPIVDAGMRQLKETGWMHNRVRMIVASFLTKDLLIDWRWGEKHFMHLLLDGDLAPNNGGWQWAASTGCDAQPYFRIFNPWLQGKRFDPNGKYIKKYVLELKDMDAKKLHSPILDHEQYPGPIVDHKTQREKALLLF